MSPQRLEPAAIVVLGEALIDLVPETVQDRVLFRAIPGGSPYNVAIGLARLGTPVAWLGALSRDPNGEALLLGLTRNGVATDLVRRTARPSALAYVFPPEAGGTDMRYSFYFEGTAEQALGPHDVPQSLDRAVAALHFGSIAALHGPHADLFAALRRRERGARLISYDPNIRPSILPDRAVVVPAVEAIARQSDLIKASAEDVAWMHPGRPLAAWAAEILAGGARAVVVTHGAEGASVHMGEGERRVAAPRTTVADTVGAGDSFMAALLYKLWSRGKLSGAAAAHWTLDDLCDAAALAARAAAVTVSRPGADPPTIAELT